MRKSKFKTDEERKAHKKEYMAEFRKTHRQMCRDARNASYRKSRNGQPIRKLIRHGLYGTPAYDLWTHAKERAKRFGLPFNLEVQDIVIPTRCPVLGIELHPTAGVPGPNSPSIDKIVPALGYVRGNIRVISHRANMLRNNASAAELRLVANDAEQLEAR
jgi:hypothetical protein